MRARFLASTLVALPAWLVVAPVPAHAQEKSTTQKVGDVGEYAMPTVALAVALAHKDGKGVGQFALVFLTTEGVVQSLKPIIDRRRPNGGGRSFPSGHTASAFMSATFLQRRYGWAYGLPAYAAATFVGYSRVHTKQHWTTDVVAGAAIGIGANLAFTHRRRGVSVTPTAGPDGLAVTMRIVW